MIDQEQTEQEKSRVYWFFFNIKTKIKSGLWGWIKKHPIWTGLFFLVLLNSLVTGRSVYQPLFVLVRKYFALVVLVLLVILFFYFLVRKKTWKQAIVPYSMLVIFLLASIFAGPAVHNYLSLYFRYATLNKVEISNIPVSGHERIQPINSIRTLIDQDALSETEDATQPIFTRGRNGEYYFTAAVGPSRNYMIQRLSKSMYEILNVPAVLPSPIFSKKQRSQVNFEIGEQLLFSHNTHTAIVKRFNFLEFFNYEPSEPMYLQNDKGVWVQVVPITRWEGFIFPRPVFGGVYVIEQEGASDNYFQLVYTGKGKYFSPEQVLQTPYLVGQNLQPKEVLNYMANSFKFANGFLAPMPGYHEGDIRIPEVPNDQRSMPFITYFNINGKGKLYNYFGLEPFEESKKGLSLSLFIPGDNDGTIFYINHRSEKFIGSSAISAKIIESKKNYDWSVNYPAESRPFVRKVNGKTRFFWLTTVVSKAGNSEGAFIGGSVPEICLTDAMYGKVVWIDQDSLMESGSWIRQAEREMRAQWAIE